MKHKALPFFNSKGIIGSKSCVVKIESEKERKYAFGKRCKRLNKCMFFIK